VSVGAAGQQQARLFETFADGGHVVVEPALGHAHRGAGRRVVQGAAEGRTVAVLRIEHAAGEYPGTAAVVTPLGAPQQQHFDA